MYSFNFDYIFNAVYNGLLAIRYGILFWILRISPADYVSDHKDDSYDGLIARGWIGSENTKAIAPIKDTVYLGNSGDNYSWWDYIKEHIFGIKINHSPSLSSSYSTNYGINPNDINFATQKVNNDPWWSNLHFSIQNPILAFCADVVSVIAFFALLAFMYSMLRWLFMALTPIREKKEKEREEKYIARRLDRESRLAQYQEARLRELENVRAIPIPDYPNNFKEKIIEDFPAGIRGLPIDEDDLSEEEKQLIKNDNDIITSYKFKNTIDPQKDKLIKIPNLESAPLPIYEDVKKDIEISNLRAERNYIIQNPSSEDKIKEFRNKWNIVINYMEGGEEALWRISILEADNLLSDILSDRGYVGLTISDKLKNAYFNTIDLAWSAHKLRNRIAHDGSNFVLTDRMARNTLELYRSVFTEFKIFE